MKKTVGIISFVFLIAILSSKVMAKPVQWKIIDGGNDHWYEAISVPEGITWTDANAAAEARNGGWHLATITSEEENDFIYNLVKGKPIYWNCCLSNNSSGPWLGAFWVGPGVGDYEWVTGEPFVYTNWGPREPFANGKRIGLFGYQASEGPYWNDIGPDRTDVVSYIIETSILPTLFISPPSGNYVTTQGFDLTLIVEAPGLSVVGGSATFDGYDVTTDLANCAIPGTLISGGKTFRCPGLTGGLLGTGTHDLEITLDLSGGISVKDTVRWDVKPNSEP